MTIARSRAGRVLAFQPDPRGLNEKILYFFDDLSENFFFFYFKASLAFVGFLRQPSILVLSRLPSTWLPPLSTFFSPPPIWGPFSVSHPRPPLPPPPCPRLRCHRHRRRRPRFQAHQVHVRIL